MSMFDPESRERSELFREKQIFDEAIEARLLERLQEGHESFPDPVTCPILTCRHPIEPRRVDDTIVLKCKNCGFERVLQNGKRK